MKPVSLTATVEIDADTSIRVEQPDAALSQYAVYLSGHGALGLFFRTEDELRRLRAAIDEALPGPARAPSATSHPQGTVIPDGSS